MNKVAVVSDFHLGCHNDSDNWHDITLKWGAWFRDQLIDQDIDRIIMCGDFFDNRNEIGVKTISVAGELMDLWKDFNITMLTGNHDMFYRNRTDVHSISIFEGRKNMTIISDMTVETIGSKKITYIPWGVDIGKLQKCDIVFGHLEINGFRMMPGKLAEGRTEPKLLINNADMTFSGHFHLREERKYLKSQIIYVGSPYQINWGEASNIPGYYIVDIDNMSYEFYENIISPKHIKMTSNLMKLDDITGNIISVDIDPLLNDGDIEAIKTKVYEQTPLEVTFNILRAEYSSDSDVKFTSNVDIAEILMNFVDDLKLERFSNEVKDKLKELYNRYAK